MPTALLIIGLNLIVVSSQLQNTNHELMRQCMGSYVGNTAW